MFRRFGLFEYTVSPFGLANSPATFMKVMNRIFFDLVDQCVVYYVDDVLIYSGDRDQHLLDIKRVFDRLRANKMCVKLSKCVFMKTKLPFCGVDVSTDGFSISDSQIEAMCQYPTKPDNYPASKYVPQFMGSVRFFQDFIPWLAEIAAPLYQLTMKGNVDAWNVNHQSITSTYIYKNRRVKLCYRRLVGTNGCSRKDNNCFLLVSQNDTSRAQLSGSRARILSSP